MSRRRQRGRRTAAERAAARERKRAERARLERGHIVVAVDMSPDATHGLVALGFLKPDDIHNREAIANALRRLCELA